MKSSKVYHESFLHYVWRMQLYDRSELRTTSGDTLRIIQGGQYNTDQGPDFLQARIALNGVQWAGHIEMHVYSSDWLKHQHQDDPNYNNVILHVVLFHDAEITMSSGRQLPTLDLRSRIDNSLWTQYERLKTGEKWIPCENLISDVPALTLASQLNRLAAERMAIKAASILQKHEANNGDWTQTIYETLAMALGLKINSDGFVTLAHGVPYTLLLKYKDNKMQVEALLLGYSGLLDAASSTDKYLKALRKEWTFLRHKHELQPMSVGQWKFLRLRPPSFPPLRIAQLAAIVCQNDRLDQIFMDGEAQHLREALQVTLEDDFWMSHYTLDKASSPKKKSISKARQNLILINAMAPIWYAMGIHYQQYEFQEKAIELLTSIPPEKSSVIKKWEALLSTPKQAMDSQALLHLKKHYCDVFRCFECAIGHRLLTKPEN